MEEDELGKEILENPKDFVTKNKNLLIKALKKIWELMTPDINYDLEEYSTEHENFFDYKNVFKNSQFIQTMTGRIKSDYIRLTRRNVLILFLLFIITLLKLRMIVIKTAYNTQYS